MSNLSTGIGLSGTFNYTQKGLTPILEAEKDLYGRRIAEKQKKDKERKELEKEVGKMLVFDAHKFTTPIYQQQYEDLMTSATADIVAKVGSGDDDAIPYASRIKQRVEQSALNLEASDVQITAMYNEVRKHQEKYAVNDAQIINNKEYPNFYAAISDKSLANKEGVAAIMKSYGGSEYNSQENPDGTVTVSYNPMEMGNPTELATEAAKLKGQYNEMNIDKPFSVGGKLKALVSYGIDEMGSEDITNAVMRDPRAVRYLEEQAYQSQKKDANALSRSDFGKSNWMQDAMSKGRESVKSHVKGLRTNMSLTDASYPAPKEDTSGPKAEAAKMFGSGAYSITGNTYAVPFAGTGQTARIVNIPKGTQVFADGDETSKPSITTIARDLEAQPVRFVFNPEDPAKSWFVYSSEFNSDGQKVSKKTKYSPKTGEDVELSSSHTFRVRATPQTMSNIAALFKTTSEAVIGEVMKNSASGPVAQINKWAETFLGAGPDAMPKGGSSTGSASGAQKAVTGQEFNAKWATLKKGESIIGPDGKTYTKK